jgi:hypothetical protein
MYKLGIVLFGQPRYYNVIKRYYDKAFTGCEIDYFIHVWNIDTVDVRNQFPDTRSLFYNKKSTDRVIKYDVNKLKQELRDIYDTSNVIVSDYDRHVYMLKRSNLVHQWRSFEKASKLLKRSKKDYDLIVCSRLDVIFELKNNLIKRLLDIVEKNKSPNNELIICASADKKNHEGYSPTSLEAMYDLLWFGTKEGIIKYGHNFTRNQINDSNFGRRGFRLRWGDQLKRSESTVYRIPGRKRISRSVIIIKPACPSFDIETIKNYCAYHKHNKRGKAELTDVKPYDPKIEYK